eukprot:6098981-Ditylum_brightwellii.AAC.1
MLLANAYNCPTKPCKAFVLSKAWLLTSPESYKNILRCHNRYLNSTTAVVIKGICSTFLEQEIAGADEDIMIRDYLLRKCLMIESMERTNKTEETGKHFFICKKTNATSVMAFLERELQSLYQKVVPSVLKYKRMPIPCRTNNKAARAVGSYKDVLQGYRNPQEETVTDNSPEFNHNLNPICSRKRQTFVLDPVSQVTTTPYAKQA